MDSQVKLPVMNSQLHNYLFFYLREFKTLCISVFIFEIEIIVIVPPTSSYVELKTEIHIPRA